MHAVAFNKHGGPDVLEVMEVPAPEPGPNDVIVRPSFTSINRLDILVREGIHGLTLPMPHIPGADIVGKIERVGSEVKGFSEGEVVVANTAYGCGKCVQCGSGREVFCSEWKCLGLQVNGSYGELVAIPASTLIRPPKLYSWEELGTMPLDLSVAWRAIRTLAQAQGGDSILVRGASGNAGLFSIFIAKALGLNVIAETRAEDKVSELKKAGAHHVIVSETKEKTQIEVKDLTGGKGVDVIVETMGSRLDDSIALASHAGRIAVFGTIAGAESNVKIHPLYLKSVSIFGLHNANRTELEEALNFAAKNNIHPIITKKLSLDQAADGQRLLEAGKVFGKISLQHWE